MIDVAVCNMALGRAGVSMFIQSPTERSNEAVVCGIYWDSCRRRVLEAFPWNFADRFADLADIGTPPGNWLHRYQYPNDCVKLRALELNLSAFQDSGVIATVRRLGEYRRYPWQVIENEKNGGKAIVTYRSGLSAWYTADIQNMTMWSEDAKSALAWLMTAEIAGPLAADPKMIEKAGAAYAQAIIEAGASNMNEGNEGQQILEQYSEFLDARL